MNWNIKIDLSGFLWIAAAYFFWPDVLNLIAQVGHAWRSIQ